MSLKGSEDITKNQKPLKPCNKFGCRNLSKTRYCEEHQTEHSNQHRYYDKQVRDKQSNSFYHSAAWKKARSIVKVRDNGLCVECMNDKRITIGVLVDHIIPIKEVWDKRLELDNLQLLCQSCHNKKTGKERANK